VHDPHPERRVRHRFIFEATDPLVDVLTLEIRIDGLSAAETRKPNENAPAVTPRDQPNSSRIGGKNSENAVRALTPTPIVTNAIATMNQP